jgi:hypothetical protein
VHSWRAFFSASFIIAEGGPRHQAVHRDRHAQGRKVCVRCRPDAAPVLNATYVLAAARIKKIQPRLPGGKVQTKFKVRCTRYLYTLSLDDPEKAEKLKHSLPPGASPCSPVYCTRSYVVHLQVLPSWRSTRSRGRSRRLPSARTAESARRTACRARALCWGRLGAHTRGVCHGRVCTCDVRLSCIMFSYAHAYRCSRTLTCRVCRMTLSPLTCS